MRLGCLGLAGCCVGTGGADAERILACAGWRTGAERAEVSVRTGPVLTGPVFVARLALGCSVGRGSAEGEAGLALGCVLGRVLGRVLARAFALGGGFAAGRAALRLGWSGACLEPDSRAGRWGVAVALVRCRLAAGLPPGVCVPAAGERVWAGVRREPGGGPDGVPGLLLAGRAGKLSVPWRLASLGGFMVMK